MPKKGNQLKKHIHNQRKQNRVSKQFKATQNLCAYTIQIWIKQPNNQNQPIFLMTQFRKKNKNKKTTTTTTKGLPSKEQERVRDWMTCNSDRGIVIFGLKPIAGLRNQTVLNSLAERAGQLHGSDSHIQFLRVVHRFWGWKAEFFLAFHDREGLGLVEAG